MTISPFTPLRFADHRTDGIPSDYMQVFADTDRILLQILGTSSVSPIVKVIDELAGRVLYYVELSKWQVNASVTLYFAEICPSPGVYSVEVAGIGRSDVFRVTDDLAMLEDTTLIQYSMKNNRQRRDTMFIIDGMQYFFDFRVPGGFKDSSWSFGVESEQFTTQLGDISQLYGLATVNKKFTLGGAIGVPVWFAEMLNRILTCTHVYFDGVKYCRKDTSVPEMEVLVEGVDSFIFSQLVQQSVNLDPVIEQTNQAIIRRIEEGSYRSLDNLTNRLIY